VSVTNQFGSFDLPSMRIESIERRDDGRVALLLLNGDEIHGSMPGALKLVIDGGPVIELNQPAMRHLGRAAPTLRTPWGAPVNGVRARLRLLEAPARPEGEMAFAMEIHNDTEKVVELAKPNFKDRVLAPKELGEVDNQGAWLTAVQDNELLEREHMERMLHAMERFRLAPGGTYRLHISVPYGNVGLRRELKKMQDRELVLGRENAVKERTDFFGTHRFHVVPGRILFRGYYRVRAAHAGNGWSGSVVTPVLPVSVPVK